ncbi:MAG: MAPEG family protein [Paracoccaceae bacterium]|jgi:uncharacterized MAPEG superfamily protein
MELFDAYSHAIVAVVLFALIILVLSPISALAKQTKGLAPGGTPEQDYSDKAYRLNRAYLNGTENLPAFAVVVFAAILTGASPFWVNLLASLILISRVIMLFVHLKGIGSPNAGPRSFAYVGGWFGVLIIGLMAMVAAF